MPTIKVTPEHAQALQRIGKATGKSLPEVFHHAVSKAHEETFGHGIDPAPLDATTPAAAAAAPPSPTERAAAHQAAFDKLSEPGDPAAMEKESKRLLSEADEDDDGGPDERSTEHQQAPENVKKGDRPNPLGAAAAKKNKLKSWAAGK